MWQYLLLLHSSPEDYRVTDQPNKQASKQQPNSVDPGNSVFDSPIRWRDTSRTELLSLIRPGRRPTEYRHSTARCASQPTHRALLEVLKRHSTQVSQHSAICIFLRRTAITWCCDPSAHQRHRRQTHLLLANIVWLGRPRPLGASRDDQQPSPDARLPARALLVRGFSSCHTLRRAPSNMPTHRSAPEGGRSRLVGVDRRRRMAQFCVVLNLSPGPGRLGVRWARRL